jgi:pimeloyl-ACP methyl ester carboxylesterase
MKISYIVIASALLSGVVVAQSPVVISVPDHGQISGDLYGTGSRGVVLAHGGRFNKESWAPQARVLADAGFTVLAINFRGDRVHPDGSPSAEGSTDDNAADVLASVRYLHSIGVSSVSAIGASLGGDAVGEADVQSHPGEIERVVFLGSDGGDEPEKLKGRKLYIVARGDADGDTPRVVPIQDHYTRAPQPKKLVVLEGTAHAQYLFATDQGQRLMREILDFVTAQ